MEVIKAGGDTLDAVIAGVNIVELDPRDSSVGYGGLPNEEGVVELDSCCMHGPSRRGGSVGALRNIKTPSKVAKAVMMETDHMMLVGEGALKFAKAMGFKEEDLLTEESRLQWLTWKKSLRDRNGHTNWSSEVDAPPAEQKKAEVLREIKEMFPHASDDLLAEAWENAIHPPHGTINCIALNEKGEMSIVTTTSGLAWKLPGRCGDSPIIGGGLWLDQDIGGAGSTGQRGRRAGSFARGGIWRAPGLRRRCGRCFRRRRAARIRIASLVGRAARGRRRGLGRGRKRGQRRQIFRALASRWRRWRSCCGGGG
jgi:N4-(beta-N-acetylglucosaminyl)-L-asparaginase